MKTPKQKSRPRASKHIERKSSHSKFVEFPSMKGRVLEKITFYSSGDWHSISVKFQDKTVLDLGITPGFSVEAKLEDHGEDSVRITKRWKAASK
jgi:hypothetical protein